jgi:DNA-binding response OmpR family regulator
MKPKAHILFAEDESSLGMIVKESLESRDFKVTWVDNGEDALEEYQHVRPDVLVLDVMMPKKDGFTLAREIRKKDNQTPIIFLTAKSQTQDVVDGFELGGNDYLKKPFSMEELIVRVNELILRQRRKTSQDQIQIGQFKFIVSRQLLIFEGSEQLLTHRETQVLRKLALQPNQLVDRALMLDEIWGEDDFFNARSMDVFITKLRKKLLGDPDVQILNVRGFGYKLVC